ncbi:coiled-coil-helix-coiled-coil-helix domain-containing protein 6 [Cricetulus griseus]|nr:coiled-coil-helix-coiled-coil-helix domain-containing protein 6 [Cricetulus griseus]
MALLPRFRICSALYRISPEEETDLEMRRPLPKVMQLVRTVARIQTQLSESVVNRMKDSSQPSAGPCPVPTVPAPTTPAPTSPPSTTSVPSMPVPIAPPPSSSDPSEGAFKAPPTAEDDFALLLFLSEFSSVRVTDSKVPRAESGGGQQPSAVKEDLKRFQQEQAVVQDELAKVAKREKEAVEKHLKASLPKKRASPTREQQKSALLYWFFILFCMSERLSSLLGKVHKTNEKERVPVNKPQKAAGQVELGMVGYHSEPGNRIQQRTVQMRATA